MSDGNRFERMRAILRREASVLRCLADTLDSGASSEVLMSAARFRTRFLPLLLLVATAAWAAELQVRLEAPRAATQFSAAEFVIHVERPEFQNPFTEAELTGEFQAPGGGTLWANGFCDAPDGRVFRLRFAPPRTGVAYRYKLRFRAGDFEKTFSGELRSAAATWPGPVVIDPEHPKHFRWL